MVNPTIGGHRGADRNECLVEICTSIGTSIRRLEEPRRIISRQIEFIGDGAVHSLQEVRRVLEVHIDIDRDEITRIRYEPA